MEKIKFNSSVSVPGTITEVDRGIQVSFVDLNIFVVKSDLLVALDEVMEIAKALYPDHAQLNLIQASPKTIFLEVKQIKEVHVFGG